MTLQTQMQGQKRFMNPGIFSHNGNYLRDIYKCAKAKIPRQETPPVDL